MRTVVLVVVNMRIFIDMDGVVADFKGEVDRHCKENGLTKLHRPEMKVDFRNMKPMPGAVEAFTELSKTFDIYILLRHLRKTQVLGPIKFFG